MEMKKNGEKIKIIIVSDIRGKKQSILPFGLKLAKHLEAEVDIIHNVDARSVHGVPSSYSDSQTIKPGLKLTYNQIIEREILHANSMLDEVLSKEASKLNFPLTINKVIKEGRIVKEIKDSSETVALSIILINEEVDDYIFHSQKEIVEFVESVDDVSLLIPPQTNFQLFKNIIFITDFSNNFGLSSLSKITSLLKFTNPQITAIDVAGPKRYLEKSLKCKKWQEYAENEFAGDVKTMVLKGKKQAPVLLDYINKVKSDLIIYSYRKPGFINHIFHGSLLEKLLKKKQYPIMYLH